MNNSSIYYIMNIMRNSSIYYIMNIMSNPSTSFVTNIMINASIIAHKRSLISSDKKNSKLRSAEESELTQTAHASR